MNTRRHLRCVAGLLAVIILVTGLTASLAQRGLAATTGTPITGDITTDQTWTVAGSPYIVGIPGQQSEVRLRRGVKLTIEPGVEVQLVHKVYFYIHGEIEARGTESEPILFTQPDPSSNFKKIWFYDGSRSFLKHTIIEYGGRDARQEDTLVMIEGGTHTFSDVTLRRSKGHAIVIFQPDSTLNMYGVRIVDNEDRGLIVYDGPSVTIRDSEFSNNTVAIRVPKTGEYTHPPSLTEPPARIDVQRTNFLRHTHATNEVVSNSHSDVFCLFAQNNWWNSTKGPVDTSSLTDACGLSTNAGGSITAGDGVDWRNYLSAPATVVGLRTAPDMTLHVTPTPAGGPYPLSTDFTFDVSGSTDDEDFDWKLEVCFDWENSGTCNTWVPADTPVVHRFETGGQKTVRVIVRDSDGLTSQETVVLDLNAPPTAAFSYALAPSTWGEIDFDASGSSDDITPPAGLLMRWDWEGDGGWDTSLSSAHRTTTHTYDKLGYYWPRLEVMDGDGLTDTTSRKIGILPPPVSTTLTVTAGSLVVPVQLVAADESVEVTIPAGTVVSDTAALPPLDLVHTPSLDPAYPLAGNLCFAGNAFALTATDGSAIDLESLGGPYTMTLSYDEDYLALLGVRGATATGLDLFHWMGEGWSPLGGSLNAGDQELTVSLTELGDFALAGPCSKIYLPAISKE